MVTYEIFDMTRRPNKRCIIADTNIYNRQLRIGDIIVEFDGQPVGTVDNLHKHLNEKVVGKKVTLGILRGGRKESVMVIPAEGNLS